MNTILFREDFNTKEECSFARRHFNVVNFRTKINAKDTIVIGRYSVLPYYKELEEDVQSLGSKLINSFKEHSYISQFYYYDDVKDYTFKTYFHSDELKEDIPYVVKGVTNSRKFQWDSMMFAKNKKEAIRIGCDLLNDGLISQQGIIFREYIPLETLEIGINGMPMSNEWRVFFYKDQVIIQGFYWSIIDDESLMDKCKHSFVTEGLPFAKKIAKIVSEKTNFFVLDVAKTASGDWILVEINDAQMSGLCSIDANNFYCNLKDLLIR